MIQGSHLLEPPPRSEVVSYEWRCDKCQLAGTVRLGTHDPAAKIFTQMRNNHHARSRKIGKTEDGRDIVQDDPKCRYPHFSWARVE